MSTQSKPPETLPEYRDNPFINNLPSILSPRGAFTALTDLPIYDSVERTRPAETRVHCAQRLARYFDPNEHHLDLETRMSALIRQGYVGRNPRTTDYMDRLQNDHVRVERRDLNAAVRPVESTAAGFALIGPSGIGKTRSVERILRLYPQHIRHTDPFSLHQITWLRLECPSQGSAKQLCIAFFEEMDRLLGTNYFGAHGSARKALDEMVVHMAACANRHALGLLVIDEIQHLMEAKGSGPDILLNFLVTLINQISVPVMIIGTSKAMPLLQGAFRQARRASGLGSALWERMRPHDPTWNYFVKRMWAFQWTREPTLLTEELSAVLYDESQGIIDVVVKLYMLSQVHAIQISAMRKRPETISETIDAKLVRHVAKTKLGVIQPMIRALRTGDTRALERYQDLTPFQSSVDRELFDAISLVQEKSGGTASPAVENKPDPYLKSFEDLGFGADIVSLVLQQTRSEHPDAQGLDFILEVMKKFQSRVPEMGTETKKRSAHKKKVPPPKPIDGDLRVIVDGKGAEAYEALEEAGMIKRPVDDSPNLKSKMA